MRRLLHVLVLVGVLAAGWLVPARVVNSVARAPDLSPCRDLGFSTEEDFMTRGPVPPDGNKLISDGDLLGPNCTVCARNRELLQVFQVTLDLGLDAVDILDVEGFIVAFSTELDSTNLGQFTAGDLLVTNGAVIPNIALLSAFRLPPVDLGLDGLHFIGDLRTIRTFVAAAAKISRQEWLENPAMLAAMLKQYEIDIWFSTEGTAPLVTAPGFLDGDVLSARTGTIVASNATVLPASVPAGIPKRGVDFGLDALAADRAGNLSTIQFSTEILFGGKPAFTDGDVLQAGNGVVRTNQDLVKCFEPVADFVGLDALHLTIATPRSPGLAAPGDVVWQVKPATTSGQSVGGASAAVALAPPMMACSDLAFSTEEDFVTQGPLPADGNPIISDGDLLGKNCAVCARNRELLAVFQVITDLGLDAVDVLAATDYPVVFSTELDSPNKGQFTAGDLLATNGMVIPNLALLTKFSPAPASDLGLDGVQLVGDIENVASFLNEAARIGREGFLKQPGLLPGMLEQYKVDIWFSTEGSLIRAGAPGFLDGDLLSARTGTIVVSQSALLPASVPAGLPNRGVDFGLDAVATDRRGNLELFRFSTEILFNGTPPFTDGDILRLGDGVEKTNAELVSCFEPYANFLGLDALSLPSLVVQPTPTPTVTPRPTLTPTVTPRPTLTPTVTQRPTLTPIRTPTATETQYVRPTNTATLTPYPTRTPSPTPTHTEIVRPTFTPTLTPWPTRTPSPTATRTGIPPTDTPTSTRIPPRTPTPTATRPPPVDFPPHDKSYAEAEIEIQPYPVQANVATHICVTIVNPADVPQTVEVLFELANFGIGLPFLPIPAAGNPRVVTLPPNSQLKLCLVWLPLPQDAGHRCIQVTLTQPGYEPRRSQRNLDIVEPLRPGHTDTLVIPVRNPLQQMVDIQLVVANTCPGWTATVEPTVLMQMAPGETRNVTLFVTPPANAVLGSGCWIDVEAWAVLPTGARQLIGGIRKVDYPPIQPHHPADPPFAQREIVIDPYPLVVGKRTTVCAVLYNPTDQDQVVTVEFSMADFGIGVPFTPIPHPDNPQVVTIPAHGVIKACIWFVPTHVGHVCIQIKISKPGYRDVYSQRNLDVMEPLWQGQGDTLVFPVGNPLDHTTDIEIEVVNNCPGWLVSAEPALLQGVAPGEVRQVQLHVMPQTGVTLGTECTVDVVAWAGDQMIGGIRKIDRPPVPHPEKDPPFAEREIEVFPLPLQTGVLTNICAVLENKSDEPQTVSVEFSMADFTIGRPFTRLPVPNNPRLVTIPPHSIIRVCIQWTPTTAGHKCFQIRISQQGYRDIISQKNLDIGENLRPGQRDELIFTVGNPSNATADIQLVVSTNGEGWQVSVQPSILEDVPPGAVRDARLIVIPPATGQLLGGDVFVDVEAYIDGELIGGIRKLALPPVKPPLGQKPYAERELTIQPDPPVVGQPAQVCVDLYNSTGADAVVDVTLYVADFGIGLPWQPVGTLTDVLVPAQSTVHRCLTWTPSPGSVNRCLQVRIQQDNWEDIVSQRNIKVVYLPGTVQLPMTFEFSVGNPRPQPVTIRLDTTALGLPADWHAQLAWTEATLQANEVRRNVLAITMDGGMMMTLALAPDTLPGDSHFVAVEAWVDDELLGGVQFDLEVSETKLFLPIVLKRR